MTPADHLQLLSDLQAFVRLEHDQLRACHVVHETDTVEDELAIDTLDEMQALMKRTQAAIEAVQDQMVSGGTEARSGRPRCYHCTGELVVHEEHGLIFAARELNGRTVRLHKACVAAFDADHQPEPTARVRQAGIYQE